jgi:hypothetical protein
MLVAVHAAAAVDLIGPRGIIVSPHRNGTLGSQNHTRTNTSSRTNSTTNNGYPQAFDVAPDKSHSSNLKYLYLFFLIFAFIVIGLVARIIIVKRRRMRKLQRTDNTRREVLQRDMEHPQMQERSPLRPSSSTHSTDSCEPPPPYHEVSHPQQAHLHEPPRYT